MIMLCERCQEREATFHMSVKTTEGNKEMFLCDVCANEVFLEKDQEHFNVNQLLNSMMGQFKTTVSCKTCGSSLTSIAEKGLFGCPDCYDTFKNEVPKIVRRVQHLQQEHEGKIPESHTGRVETKKRIEQLEQKLASLIETQNFEEAAVVRDEINALKGV